ncbi:MAG: glycoside hydrolase family 65 protein, partial [Mycobacterium sp.]|nr:glycoside hydrolase family 65 protein [Mycobacterium sp.]
MIELLGTHAPAPRRARRVCAGLAALATAVLLLSAVAAAEPSPHGRGADTRASEDAGWVLKTTDTSGGYAPTFVGNGYLAARVPAAGEGFSDSPVLTESELAGFYARPAGQYERRAALPTWTTLGFGQGSEIYGVAGPSAPSEVAATSGGSTGNYRQALDIRTGSLTTSFDWTSPSGRRTSLSYVVNANRADGHLGTVELTAVPRWSGTATVVDGFDAHGLEQASTTDASVDGKTATMAETVVSDGGVVTAGMASALRVDGSTVATVASPAGGDGTVGQIASFPVRAGRSYRITKYVGVASSVDTDRSLSAATPQRAAVATAVGAAARGYRETAARNDHAWAALWAANISVPKEPAMTAQIHAAMFYLLASMRSGVTWSTSPAGLSSNGYNGHVFWDMETWMYPALLAQYPDIAVGADSYRQKLLPAAEAATAALSTPSHPIHGAKFPWESALSGVESTPPPFPEGTDEIHIDSDIALAQWQYFEATGDTAWLRNKA